MRTRDQGAAALELTLLIPVLIALLGIVGPLAALFYDRVQLGRTSGDVIRFATSRSDAVRTVNGVTVAPGAAANASGLVQAEATRTHTGRSPVTTTYSTSVDRDCPTGRRGTVVVTTTVDLGPLVGLVLTDPTKTLQATATSCEE